jgi:hypothetical protein
LAWVAAALARGCALSLGDGRGVARGGDGVGGTLWRAEFFCAVAMAGCSVDARASWFSERARLWRVRRMGVVRCAVQNEKCEIFVTNRKEIEPAPIAVNLRS